MMKTLLFGFLFALILSASNAFASSFGCEVEDTKTRVSKALKSQALTSGQVVARGNIRFLGAGYWATAAVSDGQTIELALVEVVSMPTGNEQFNQERRQLYFGSNGCADTSLKNFRGVALTCRYCK
jgi:sulfur carrier protein ThiS